jgi:hypothetical protein
MNKKAIAILGGIFILIVGTLGVIIYLRSNSDSDVDAVVIVDPAETTVEEEPIDFPEFEEPEPAPDPADSATKLTDEPVITPALFFQGNGIAYFNTSGQLFRTDMTISDGTVLLSNKTEVVVPPKSDISKVLWPLVGNSYIAESGIGMAKSWNHYNPETGQYVPLPSAVKSVSWMPTGTQIMFVWVDGNGKATLNLGNPDTTGYQTLTEFWDNDVQISVSPDGKYVGFYRTQTADMNKNGIYTVTADGQSWGDVVIDGYNRGMLWSPDSSKMLFTKLDPATQKFTLWYADFVNKQVRSLGVTTSETKAVWTKDSQNIVVAVPTSGTVGQGATSDTFYRMNVATGSREEFSPGSGVDGQELFLSMDETIVFFRNAQDGALYSLFLN